MGSFTFDVIPGLVPVRLYLGAEAAGPPGKDIEFGNRHGTTQDRDQDIFHPADDISAVCLVAMLVIRLCGLLYFQIRSSFYKGSKVL